MHGSAVPAAPTRVALVQREAKRRLIVALLVCVFVPFGGPLYCAYIGLTFRRVGLAAGTPMLVLGLAWTAFCVAWLTLR